MRDMLLGLLVGLSLFCRGDAVLNLLGRGISVPLIKWDATSIENILSDSTEIWETCIDNNNKRSDLVVKQAALKNCNKHLDAQGIDFTDTMGSLKSACEGFKNFKQCYHKVLKQVKNLCHLIGEDKEYLENAENIHTEISEKLCEKDEKRLKDFALEGMKCATEKKAELEECTKKYTVKDMEYDTDDCRKAWAFVGCVEDEMESCEEGSSKVPVEVMKAGLMKTKCNDEDPSGGSSISPLFLLSLLAGFFAVNIA